jgi:hypothetical protein
MAPVRTSQQTEDCSDDPARRVSLRPGTIQAQPALLDHRRLSPSRQCAGNADEYHGHGNQNPQRHVARQFADHSLHPFSIMAAPPETLALGLGLGYS